MYLSVIFSRMTMDNSCPPALALSSLSWWVWQEIHVPPGTLRRHAQTCADCFWVMVWWCLIFTVLFNSSAEVSWPNCVFCGNPGPSSTLGHPNYRPPDSEQMLDSSTVGGLEPWNFMTCHNYWEFHHPNWRSHIVQRGGSTTNAGDPHRLLTSADHHLDWRKPINIAIFVPWSLCNHNIP